MPVLFPFGSNFCVFCCSYAHWHVPVTGFCSTQSGVYEARRKPTQFIVQATVPALGCYLHLTFQNFLYLSDIRSFICSQQEKQGNVYSFFLPSEVRCPFNGRYVLRSVSNVKWFTHVDLLICLQNLRIQRNQQRIREGKVDQIFSDWQVIICSCDVVGMW